MGPKKLYLDAIASGKIKNDPMQNDAVTELQRIYLELSKKSGLLRRNKNITGLYLWGNVGVGKSMLINMLYSTLGDKIAYRGHYHQWMATIHKEINALQGNKNPIKICAKNWGKRYRAIILDEFLVTNIVDAMIMANWLQELHANKVTLITTSNTEPHNLYRNGMGREKFLPAIDLLEEHNTVLHLDSEQDYRTLTHTIKNGFITPCNANNDIVLRAAFTEAANGISLDGQEIIIHDRAIKVIDHSITAVWIDFMHLCDIPRSQLDYIALAQKYKTIIISNIRALKPNEHNLAENLIKAIDVFYDADTNIIVCCNCNPDEIYPTGRHAQAFLRTASRFKSLGIMHNL